MHSCGFYVFLDDILICFQFIFSHISIPSPPVPSLCFLRRSQVIPRVLHLHFHPSPRMLSVSLLPILCFHYPSSLFVIFIPPMTALSIYPHLYCTLSTPFTSFPLLHYYFIFCWFFSLCQMCFHFILLWCFHFSPNAFTPSFPVLSHQPISNFILICAIFYTRCFRCILLSSPPCLCFTQFPLSLSLHPVMCFHVVNKL